MVDTKILKPGDRVRIVDRWPADGSAVQNPEVVEGTNFSPASESDFLGLLSS